MDSPGGGNDVGCGFFVAFALIAALAWMAFSMIGDLRSRVAVLEHRFSEDGK